MPAPLESVIAPLSAYDKGFSASASLTVSWVLTPPSPDAAFDAQGILDALKRVADKWRLIAGRVEWLKDKKRYGIRVPLGELPTSYAMFHSLVTHHDHPFPEGLNAPLTPSSALYTAQLPLKYFRDPTTPCANKDHAAQAAPLLSLRICVFTDCVCIGVTFPHGVFDGSGLGLIIEALDAEFHGREWAVPEIQEINLVDQAFEKWPTVETAYIYRVVRPATYLAIAALLWSMLVQMVWHGVELGTIFLGTEMIERIVTPAKEEVKRLPGDEWVSTGDVLTAWFIKAALRDECRLKSASSYLLPFWGTMSARDITSEAMSIDLKQYPHNFVLPFEVTPVLLSELGSQTVAQYALTIRRSLNRWRHIDVPARAHVELSAGREVVPAARSGEVSMSVVNQISTKMSNIDWGWEVRWYGKQLAPVPWLDQLTLSDPVPGSGMVSLAMHLRHSRWVSLKKVLAEMMDG